MKQTKYFNQNIPQLGDQANITVVSDAICANEENYSGKIEYMNATNAGSKIILNSDSRTNKNVGYYKGMAFVFGAPIPLVSTVNYTLSVDGLREQPLRLNYDINRGEELHVVYNKVDGFSVLNTSIPRSSSLTSTSEVTVATSKAVKQVNDKVNTVSNEVNKLDKNKENAFSKKSGFNLDKSNSVTSNSSNTLATSAAVKTAYDKASQAQHTADEKVSKYGDTINGTLNLNNGTLNVNNSLALRGMDNGEEIYRIGQDGSFMYLQNRKSNSGIRLYNSGSTEIKAGNLNTSSKEVVSAINELNSGKVSKNGDTMTGGLTVESSIGNHVVLKRSGELKGSLTSNVDGIALYNEKSKKMIELRDNGDVKIPANNLDAQNKDVIESLNKNNGQWIGSNGLKDVDTLTKNGWYKFGPNSKNAPTGAWGVVNNLTSEGGAIHQFWISTLLSGDIYHRKLGEDWVRMANENDIDELNSGKENKIDKKSGFNLDKTSDYKSADTNKVFTQAGANSLYNELNSKIATNCPYNIGDIYITTNSGNPSTTWLGTTWEKIEGRFLLGSSGGASAGTTGGSMSKTLSKSNLPNVKLKVDQFSVSIPPHTHPLTTYDSGGSTNRLSSAYSSRGDRRTVHTGESNQVVSGTASPYTEAIGSGESFDIRPAYYTVHIWKRRG